MALNHAVTTLLVSSPPSPGNEVSEGGGLWNHAHWSVEGFTSAPSLLCDPGKAILGLHVPVT